MVVRVREIHQILEAKAMESRDDGARLKFDLVASIRKLQGLIDADADEVGKSGYRKHAGYGGGLPRDYIRIQDFAGKQFVTVPKLDLQPVGAGREYEFRSGIETISLLVGRHGEATSVTAGVKEDMFAVTVPYLGVGHDHTGHRDRD